MKIVLDISYSEVINYLYSKYYRARKDLVVRIVGFLLYIVFIIIGNLVCFTSSQDIHDRHVSCILLVCALILGSIFLSSIFNNFVAPFLEYRSLLGFGFDELYDEAMRNPERFGKYENSFEWFDKFSKFDSLSFEEIVYDKKDKDYCIRYIGNAEPKKYWVKNCRKDNNIDCPVLLLGKKKTLLLPKKKHSAGSIVLVNNYRM